MRAGKLVISTRQGKNVRTAWPIDYCLTANELSSIAITSSGEVEAGDVQSGSFSVTISGSGDVSITSLDCTSLKVTISSSGSVDISGGEAHNQDIKTSSRGEYRARDLPSAEAYLTLSSSGTAIIRVSDRLIGSLSSSGDVRYIGNPRVDVRTSSSGRAVQVAE